MKSWNWWAWQIFRCLSPYLLLYFLGTTQRSILTSNIPKKSYIQKWFQSSSLDSRPTWQSEQIFIENKIGFFCSQAGLSPLAKIGTVSRFLFLYDSKGRDRFSSNADKTLTLGNEEIKSWKSVFGMWPTYKGQIRSRTCKIQVRPPSIIVEDKSNICSF